MPRTRGRQALLLAFASAALWSAVGAALCRWDALTAARCWWLDELFAVRQRLGAAPRPHEDVLIIGVDERTRDALRRRLGGAVEDRRVFRRAVGLLLAELSRAGAKVAAVDFLLNVPTTEPLDAAVVDALAGGGDSDLAGIDAVLACHLTVSESKRPARRFMGLADEGNIALPSDPDGKFRRVRPGLVGRRPAVFQPGDVRIPLFAFQACRLHVGSADKEYGSARATGWTWHDGPGADGSVEVPGHFRLPAEMLIDFVGPAQTFAALGRQFSALDVIDGKVPRETFGGKLVLIGPALRGSDRFAVSVRPDAGDAAYRRHFERTLKERFGVDVREGLDVKVLRSFGMSGVEIHANLASQILDGRRLRELAVEAPAAPPAGIAAVLLATSWLFWRDPVRGRRRTRRWIIGGGAGMLAGLAAAAAGSAALFAAAGWVVVPIELMAAWAGQSGCGIAYSGARLRRQGRRIEAMFGSAVGEELLDYIHAHPETLTRTRTADATVLFADIRGFTPLTSALGAGQVVDLLRDHFEALWHPLADQGAWVDKYVGDLVMAAWNVLRPMDDHALRAVKAAVGMKIARDRLNRDRAAAGRAAIEIGIGIHTGPVVAGNIGSRRRANFTVIGETVNFAARVEGQATRGELLISEDTYRRVADHVVARPRGPVALRGVAGRHTLYEVAGLVGGPPVPDAAQDG